MPRDSEQDLVALREWMSKEPHLPRDLLVDELLLIFLHSCYYSLEKTKKCIDNFCSSRVQMPEVYTNRDPLTPTMKTMLDNVLQTTNTFNGNYEYIIFKYDDPTLETFRFYEVVKSISIMSDIWVKSCPPLVEGHYILVDMTHFSLKLIPKVNIMYLRDFLMFLLEAMPVRVKKIIGVNAPPFYEKLYAFIKPIFPAEINSIIHFFTDLEGLHQMIDKKYLPKEYGGDAQGIYEQNREWRKKIEGERIFFANDNSWKADIKKKPKGDDKTMSGSFRTLSID